MDIELLRTFWEVDRLRHFRRAADDLCISQGAVSTRIKFLEAQLGVTLFIRQHRQIDLKSQGHRFKRDAERLIAEWRKARHNVSLGELDSQLAVGGTRRTRSYKRYSMGNWISVLYWSRHRLTYWYPLRWRNWN